MRIHAVAWLTFAGLSALIQHSSLDQSLMPPNPSRRMRDRMLFTSCPPCQAKQKPGPMEYLVLRAVHCSNVGRTSGQSPHFYHAPHLLSDSPSKYTDDLPAEVAVCEYVPGFRRIWIGYRGGCKRHERGGTHITQSSMGCPGCIAQTQRCTKGSHLALPSYRRIPIGTCSKMSIYREVYIERVHRNIYHEIEALS